MNLSEYRPEFDDSSLLNVHREEIQGQIRKIVDDDHIGAILEIPNFGAIYQNIPEMIESFQNHIKTVNIPPDAVLSLFGLFIEKDIQDPMLPNLLFFLKYQIKYHRSIPPFCGYANNIINKSFSLIEEGQSEFLLISTYDLLYYLTKNDADFGLALIEKNVFESSLQLHNSDNIYQRSLTVGYHCGRLLDLLMEQNFDTQYLEKAINQIEIYFESNDMDLTTIGLAMLLKICKHHCDIDYSYLIDKISIDILHSPEKIQVYFFEIFHYISSCNTELLHALVTEKIQELYLNLLGSEFTTPTIRFYIYSIMTVVFPNITVQLADQIMQQSIHDLSQPFKFRKQIIKLYRHFFTVSSIAIQYSANEEIINLLISFASSDESSIIRMILEIFYLIFKAFEIQNSFEDFREYSFYDPICECISDINLEEYGIPESLIYYSNIDDKNGQ